MGIKKREDGEKETFCMGRDWNGWGGLKSHTKWVMDFSVFTSICSQVNCKGNRETG